MCLWGGGRCVYEEVGRCVYGEVGDVSVTLYVCPLATIDVQVLQCCMIKLNHSYMYTVHVL